MISTILVATYTIMQEGYQNQPDFGSEKALDDLGKKKEKREED